MITITNHPSGSHSHPYCTLQGGGSPQVYLCPSALLIQHTPSSEESLKDPICVIPLLRSSGTPAILDLAAMCQCMREEWDNKVSMEHKKKTKLCSREMPTPTTCCSHSYDSEEVGHSHMCYALKNIPRTKNHQYNNRKRCAAKIMMGLGGFHDAKSVSPVRSNIACLCDLQTAFMWLLRAKGTAVIDLNLIDSFSMVVNTPQPE